MSEIVIVVNLKGKLQSSFALLQIYALCKELPKCQSKMLYTLYQEKGIKNEKTTESSLRDIHTVRWREIISKLMIGAAVSNSIVIKQGTPSL